MDILGLSNPKTSHVSESSLYLPSTLTPRILDYTLHPSSVGQFFMDYYHSVASHGVQFTKCDNMASLDNLKSAHEIELTFDGDASWKETIGKSDLS